MKTPTRRPQDTAITLSDISSSSFVWLTLSMPQEPRSLAMVFGTSGSVAAYCSSSASMRNASPTTGLPTARAKDCGPMRKNAKVAMTSRRKTATIKLTSSPSELGSCGVAVDVFEDDDSVSGASFIVAVVCDGSECLSVGLNSTILTASERGKRGRNGGLICFRVKYFKKFEIFGTVQIKSGSKLPRG